MESVKTVKREPQVRISNDEMSAYVTLPMRNVGDEYVIADVMAALSQSRVTYGIKQDKIREMVEQRNYGREVLVAEGKPLVPGRDAEFKFNFDTDLHKRPLVREDGSVDYWSIHSVEVVEEGQVIATYVEPVDGENGMTVRGKPLAARRGRPLPPLTGKGFERSEDNRVYTASMSGKIEKSKNRITILPVYEVNGDADVNVGNIDFRGDVIIHGNVCSGEKIRCSGSLTVDGVSEGCTMEAGKDIILRGGVVGAEKTRITAKGSIIAKFIEYSYVEAEGFIEADSAMNSEITSYDRLYFHGNPGSVVGGSVFGCAGVEADCLGNSTEIKTEAGAGIHRKLRERQAKLENDIQEAKELIEDYELRLSEFEEYAAQKGIDVTEDERRIGILKKRIETQSRLYEYMEALSNLEAIKERAKDAIIKVNKSVYPGVNISIDEVSFVHKHKDTNVEFYRIGDNIRMLPVGK